MISNVQIPSHILSRFFDFKNQLKKPSFWSPLSGPKTFLQMHNDVVETRNRLQQISIQSGDLCLLLFHFSYDFIILLFALLANGCIPVFIDPRLSKTRWKKLAELAQVKHVFYTKETRLARLFFLPNRKKINFVNVSRIVVVSKSVEKFLPLEALKNPPGKDPAILITFTSGSTGLPKVVSRKLKVLGSQQSLFCTYFDILDYKPHLALHGIGSIQSLIQGSPTYYVPSSTKFTKNLVRTLVHFKIETFSAPPGIIDRVILELNQQKLKVETLRFLITGGAPIPRWMVFKGLDAFPNAHFVNVYGSNECEPISILGFCKTVSPKIKFQQIQLEAYPKANGYPIGNPIAELTCEMQSFKNTESGFFEHKISGPNCTQSHFQSGDVLRNDKGLIMYCGRSSDTYKDYPCGFLESYLENCTSIKRAAVKESGKHLTIFLELFNDEKMTTQQLVNLSSDFKANFNFLAEQKVKLQIIKKIPVDPRHLWKIQKHRL